MPLFKKKVQEQSNKEQEQLNEAQSKKQVSVNRNVEKLKVLSKKYAPSIISVLVLAAVIPIVNAVVLSGVSATLNEKQSRLVEINNEIYKLNESERQVQYIVKDADVDLDKDVWSKDDEYFYNFIKDAFVYTGLDEYKTRRKDYIQRLGHGSDFVKNCLPVMNVSGDAYSDRVYEGDAEDLVSCNIKNMKSDIFAIDKTKYTYVTQLQLSKKVYDEKSKTMRSLDVDAVCVYNIYHSDKGLTLDTEGFNGVIMK